MGHSPQELFCHCSLHILLSPGLSLFWTGAKQRGFTLHDVVRVLCEQPSKLCHLDSKKGQIAVGMDADFVIWDPDAEFKVIFRYSVMFKFYCMHLNLQTLKACNSCHSI